jgi:hypothetical protein
MVDWEKHRRQLRDPQQILGPTFAEAGLGPEAARFRIQGQFLELLERLRLVLLVTREYENLVVALGAEGGRIRQSFLPVPHPSGLAVDRKNGRVYLNSTRNPNYIQELMPVCEPGGAQSWLQPTRSKAYPGHTYFHDLVCQDGLLWANSVGQNGVLKVNFDDPRPDPLCWWPRCVENEQGRPVTHQNYLQLNSIALGPTWEESFFTASCAKMSRRRPWHLNYPVDGRGVLFSAASREVVGRGLTRPHSARFYEGKVWVNNSGYGQLGYFEGPHYRPQIGLGSWTRGLTFHPAGICWVGLSRVLPRFHHYAPGLKADKARCGLAALCTRTMQLLGTLIWPAGNQIFGIEWIEESLASGFCYQGIRSSSKQHQQKHYRYCVK